MGLWVGNGETRGEMMEFYKHRREFEYFVSPPADIGLLNWLSIDFGTGLKGDV